MEMIPISRQENIERADTADYSDNVMNQTDYIL